MDFRRLVVQRRNVRSALDDKLSIAEVHREQCRRKGKEAKLLSIWHYSVLTNLRHTHLKQNGNWNIWNKLQQNVTYCTELSRNFN
jgi:hypothetical protein